MEGYSGHPMCLLHVYHLISETKRFFYPDELSMDGKGFLL